MERKDNIKRKTVIISMALSTLFLSLLLLFPISSYAVDDSLCARVKIEIRQEMTLERQAFDAHMRINNGLSHISIEDVSVEVTFLDEAGSIVQASYDPDDTEALFFIRLDSMENISDVSGSGTVGPSSSADIHWLIIPAPGASNGLESGTLYYVGATLSYTIGGEEHVTVVSPDYIFVKPMPLLTLDYFLPADVYGDDAFTQEIEPPIPFSLGVRISNNGPGTARDMKIDSVQPKIIENELGLLIGFTIEGCEVNDKPAAPTLLADLGDIGPYASSVARWIMTCTLSGQFIDFEAEFSHADELGGELTSLMEAINTHFLVHDVLVDIPGRDGARDFLAKDVGVYRIYESQGGDTSVMNQSNFSSLVFTGQSGTETHYSLSTPVTAGFMYVQLPDPHGGQKVIKEAIRSDGKYIKSENIWFSKTRNEDHTWQHFVNLFDVNTMGSYSVVFGDADEVPHPPVLQFIPDRSRAEGEQLSFIVEASDPDGTTPSLLAAPLPAGAVFTDQGNGQAIFDWTPSVGQAGKYEITFSASDGQLKDSQSAVLTICPVSDTDCDGMADAWEMDYFGNLDRDGTGDFDGDGISDLDEYLNGSDPASNHAPTAPVIDSPEDGGEVFYLQPDLVIQNSTDPDGDVITYIFEVFSDQEMTDLVTSQSDVAEEIDYTMWTIPAELTDNTWYYWRVRASDGNAYSSWVYGSFFVNTENDMPGDFNISSPQDGSEVDTQYPVLQVTNSFDVDGDVLTYTFEVSEDSSMGIIVASANNIQQGGEGATSWVVDLALEENTWYFWKATAIDEHGAETETSIASFFVNTLNETPQAPLILSPAIGSEIEFQDVELTVENASDPDGDELIYFFEIDKANTFDSEDLQTSGEIPEGLDTTSWNVTGLEDNTIYYWRVKVSDGAAESGWAQGNFFVNTVNDPPSIPTPRNPGQGAWVETLTPQLEINPSVDVDNDQITYHFEVYLDSAPPSLVAQGTSDTVNWTISLELNDNTWYFWKANAVDEHGLASGWMEESYFFTNNNGFDDPPNITMLQPLGDQQAHASGFLIQWDDSDPDSNADIAIYYDMDSSGGDGTFIQQGLKEDPDDADDTYLWDISGMEEGIYYIYAIIADASSTLTSYASGTISIDKTPPEVSASPPGGTYNSAQSIALSVNEPSDIYYTMDGSDPSTSSSLYVSPIEITQATMLKLMAVDTAGNQSSIVTETYDINYPPIVNAGSDQTLSEGDTVSFSGSFTDPDSDSHTIEWDFGDSYSYSGDLTPTHTYKDNGVYTVTLIVTDDNGSPGTGTLSITVNNVAPTVEAGDDRTVGEGETISFIGSFTDPGDDTHTIEWDFGDGFGEVGTLTPTHFYEDNGDYIVSLIVTDDDGGVGTDDAIVMVYNIPPVIGEIGAPLDPVQVNLSISTVAYFIDSGILDTHTATWDWGDGSTSSGEIIEYAGSGSVTGEHFYITPGVYTIRLTVADNDNDLSESIFQYVVIYDPDGGFVTGGGWINSPEGAYAPDPLLIGKATFGFVSKYKKGINTPTGETEFNFKVADMNFHSYSYEWMVVAGSRTQFKGTGTINGAGNYGFMLTAIDAALTPITDVDLFRIKIWDKDNNDTIVYDNQMESDDDAQLTTAIGGGSIVIHDK